MGIFNNPEFQIILLSEKCSRDQCILTIYDRRDGFSQEENRVGHWYCKDLAHFDVISEEYLYKGTDIKIIGGQLW